MPKEAKKSLRSSAARSTAGSDFGFGGSQTSYARSNRSSLPNRELAHSRDDTCESCRLWTGRLKDSLWETCLRIDPTVKDCTNRPRRTRRKKNLCQSCLPKATTSHHTYADRCRNPHSTVVDCSKTPLYLTDQQAEGSREPGENAYEGDTGLGSMCGPQETVDNFHDLMRDLNALDPSGTFVVPSEEDGGMLEYGGRRGSAGSFDGLMEDLDALIPTGTVIGPSDGIVEDMKVFDQQIRSGQRGFGDVGTSGSQ